MQISSRASLESSIVFAEWESRDSSFSRRRGPIYFPQDASAPREDQSWPLAWFLLLRKTIEIANLTSVHDLKEQESENKVLRLNQELDEATELDEGNPVELGAQYK